MARVSRTVPKLVNSLLGMLSILVAVPSAHGQAGSISVTDHLVVTGDQAFDQFGAQVAAAGDVNADGFADFIASSVGGGQGPGSPSYVRVLSGRNGAVLHEFRGDSDAETLFGTSLGAAGDVNDDGFPDVIVGSPNPDPTAPIFGSVYVFSGADGALLHRFVEASFNDDFGRAVAGVGDVDGDGSDDLAIGAPLAAFTRGVVQVRSGATGSVLRTFFGVGGEQLGQAVAAIGDLDSDGTPDVLIGSPGGVPGSCPACIRVYSGFDGAPLLTITNGDPESRLGAAVASAGDLTGDGIPDIVAGAPNASIVNPQDGAAYLFSGATGDQVFRWTDRVGVPLPSAFASTVTAGADIDGDSVPDIVVGAPFAKGAANGLARGIVYGYSGQDGSPLFRITGETDREMYGSSVAIVGDANGDGFANLVAGAPQSSALGAREGSLRVVRRVAMSGGVLCRGEPNSTGISSTLDARSSSLFDVAANDLDLDVSDLPPGVIGFFVVSRDFNVANMVGGGEGKLCIASGDIGRYSASLNVSSPFGEVGFTVDNTAIPLPSGGGAGVSVAPGDTLNFQFWHRDAGASGAPTSNLSDAVTVTFL